MATKAPRSHHACVTDTVRNSDCIVYRTLRADFAQLTALIRGVAG